MPSLLVLPPRFTDDSVRLWRAAIRAGWDVERLASWRAPAGLHGRPIVLYGEPLFVAAIAEELGVAPIEPPLDWAARLPRGYLHREVHFGTLEEARRLAGPVFVKPADDKCFASRVYAGGAELPDEARLDGQTAVLWAEPVHWEVEYRCFVRERCVATMSPYLRAGEPAVGPDGVWTGDHDEHESALAFTETVLANPDVALPPAAVLDVGLIRERGWAVVEANAAWGSGLCGCDDAAVLEVLERAVVPQDMCSATDRAWIRPWQ